VVVTIFVNRSSSTVPRDLEKYPRDLNADIAFCERLGADAVFARMPREMYPTQLLASGSGGRDLHAP
jgi:pantoate--beta-alanine ligase